MNDELSVWKGKPVPDDMFLKFHIAIYQGLGFALQELPRPKRPSLTDSDQTGIEKAGQMLYEMSLGVQELGMIALATRETGIGKGLEHLFGRFRPMLETLAQVKEAYSPNDLAHRIAIRRVKESMAAIRRDLKRGIDGHLADLREKEQPCPKPTRDDCAILAESDRTSEDPCCANNVKAGSVEPTSSSENGKKSTGQQGTR